MEQVAVPSSSDAQTATGVLTAVPFPPDFCPVLSAAELARYNEEAASELANWEATGCLDVPDNLDNGDDPAAPRWLSEQDLYEELPPMTRVDGLEWELWAGVDQDEAEREMLRRKAPAWVFLPPGGDLAAALETVRVQWESPIALIEVIKAAARMSAWSEAIKIAAIASFHRQRKAQATEIPRPTQIDSSGRPIDPQRSWTAEIGAALHLSTDTAARHVDTALHLTRTLSATHSALRCGALSWSKALAISEATRALSGAAAQAVEADVLRRAASQTHKNLSASLRRQVAKHAAKEESDRHRDARTERTCKIVPLSDGMAGLWVVHTADKIQQMWIVVQAMADLAKRGNPTSTDAPPASSTSPADSTHSAPTTNATHVTNPADSADTATPTTGAASASSAAPRDVTARATSVGPPTQAASTNSRAPSDEPATGEPTDHETPRMLADARSRDERSAPQRRADVVADVFEHMLHNGLDWLNRRLPDQHKRRPHIEVVIPVGTLLGLDDDPCELTGYGPIPAEMARRIAADGTWRRLLTDPFNGTVLEASTTRHDPGALVSETLLARHPVCAWPGCNRQSRECDRDHTTPFAKNGRTTLTGLAPYCEYHHVIKDTPAWGWSATNHSDGSVTLIAPTGHRYTTVPPARGPILHPTPEASTNQRPPYPPNAPPPF